MAPLLTDRYDTALTYTRDKHRNHVRKGAGIPYISHLMSVSAMVLEMGGDEDAAIAGLLHDVVEDQHVPFSEIETKFGPQVRLIVELCTDSTDEVKADWLPRKQQYLERMAVKADTWEDYQGYFRVALADKLHNARSTRADIFNDGDDSVFDLFKGAGVDRAQRKQRTLSYYSDILRILERVHVTSPGFCWYRHELRRVVTEMGGGDDTFTLFR